MPTIHTNFVRLIGTGTLLETLATKTSTIHLKSISVNQIIKNVATRSGKQGGTVGSDTRAEGRGHWFGCHLGSFLLSLHSADMGDPSLIHSPNRERKLGTLLAPFIPSDP